MKTMINQSIVTLSLFLASLYLSACSDQSTTIIKETEMDNFELKYGGELHPIKSSNFERYILVENTSIESCKSSIVEYCELNVLEENKNISKNYDKYNLKLSQKGNWLIVKFPKEFPFYSYHNLVGWIWDSDRTYGFSIHQISPNESYYVELDTSDDFGDVLVGADRSENSLYSYLPDAYIEGGNLRVTSEIKYSYSEALEKLSSANIELDSSNLTWESFDVKLFY